MLGENIRKIRELNNYSINALAKKCGISAGYISDLEKNKKENPSKDILKAIAIVLNVSVEDFYKDDIPTQAKNPSDEITMLTDEQRLMLSKVKNLSPEDRKKIFKMIEIFEKENND